MAQSKTSDLIGKSFAFRGMNERELIDSFNSLMENVDPKVSMIGFGEALHFGEEFLVFRNELFKNLVKCHGFKAIAVESGFLNGFLANDYVRGKINDQEEAYSKGFTHDFGKLESNKELIQWMRKFNENCKREEDKISFYGFDAPTEAYFTSSPRQCLEFGIRYLEKVNQEVGEKYRKLVEQFLGEDSAWENREANMNRSKSIGLSEDAKNLRIVVEDLILELEILSDQVSDEYKLALHLTKTGRTLLGYHATLAGNCSQDRLLTIRDYIAFQNMEFIKEREGKIFLFAHNAHLQKKEAVLPWYRFFPLGSRLHSRYGEEYFFIAGALGSSDESRISSPEEGTLEDACSKVEGEGLIIRINENWKVFEDLPTRSGSKKNMSYNPTNPKNLEDIDALAFIKTVTWTRGAPTFPDPPQLESKE